MLHANGSWELTQDAVADGARFMLMHACGSRHMIPEGGPLLGIIIKGWP